MLSSRRPRNHSCWNQAGSSAIDSLRSTGHFIEMHRFVRYFCICFVGKVKRSVLSLEKHRNKHYVSNVLPCATLFYSWPIIIHSCFLWYFERISHVMSHLDSSWQEAKTYDSETFAALALHGLSEEGRVKRCEKVKLSLLNVAISPLKIYNGFSKIFHDFRQFAQDETKIYAACSLRTDCGW